MYEHHRGHMEHMGHMAPLYHNIVHDKYDNDVGIINDYSNDVTVL